jgi:hypothetical protein
MDRAGTIILALPPRHAWPRVRGTSSVKFWIRPDFGRRTDEKLFHNQSKIASKEGENVSKERTGEISPISTGPLSGIRGSGPGVDLRSGVLLMRKFDKVFSYAFRLTGLPKIE